MQADFSALSQFGFMHCRGEHPLRVFTSIIWALKHPGQDPGCRVAVRLPSCGLTPCCLVLRMGKLRHGEAQSLLTVLCFPLLSLSPVSWAWPCPPVMGSPAGHSGPGSPCAFFLSCLHLCSASSCPLSPFSPSTSCLC